MRIHILLIGFSLACGGEAPASNPTSEPTSGNDTVVVDSAEDDYEDEEEMIEVPEPTGPGRIHAVIRMQNEERAGTVTVMSPNGDTVAEGNSGDTFDVPSGDYSVVAMLDPALLPGHTGREERARVAPGQTAEVVFSYEVARVRLNVRRGGRALNTWRMVLTRQGSDTEITLQSSTEHAEVAPGRYSGVLTAGGARIEVSGLIFQGGATMDVPVNVN
ncbi:MAG: hypothetical protein ACI9KE_000359 [Polyangiales bacterium]|jgi:hypothetical protein